MVALEENLKDQQTYYNSSWGGDMDVCTKLQPFDTIQSKPQM